MAYDLTPGIQALIIWEKNTRTGGVMSRYGGIIVLSSGIGATPHGNEGRIRERMPVVGEVEACVLYRNPNPVSKNYFAWPTSFPVKDTRAFLVLDENGDPVGTLIPVSPDVEIEAWPEGHSTHIVITPRPR